MKLLLDQDVYELTYLFLKRSTHDILRASDVGLSQASDEEILSWSQSQNRILITRDKDFGELVFLKRLGNGVIFLRMVPHTLDDVHKELTNVLSSYSEEDLRKSFVVVEKGRHRFRKLSD
ncbi:MAG: DUF5615 family PIN-like protein [Ignavibacteriae bacterium]|nr:DUF5615 family PIN-like protein [Ignavibacteriota bacterium]